MFVSNSSGLIIILNFSTQYDFNAYFLAFLGLEGAPCYYLIYLQL
jgi:hypothetical protein